PPWSLHRRRCAARTSVRPQGGRIGTLAIQRPKKACGCGAVPRAAARPWRRSGPSHEAAPACPHGALRPLALIGPIGALKDFAVHLPALLAAEPKITPNRLERRPLSDQPLKVFERIRAIFLLKLPLKFIRRLNVEFMAPVSHSRHSDVQYAGNLRIGERLSLDFGPQKLFKMGLIDVHCSPPCPP